MSGTSVHPAIDQSDNAVDHKEESSPPPPSLDSGHLSWRIPPEESFSDWTIKIVKTTESSTEAVPEQKDVYHVHKCVLAVGPKMCRYFERLFQNPQFSECESRTSTIQLCSSVAAAFLLQLQALKLSVWQVYLVAQGPHGGNCLCPLHRPSLFRGN